MMRKAVAPLLLALALLAGCSVNPVTGERELVFISTAQEIEMGRQNYLPMQQSQGGEYDVDPGLTAYVQRVGGTVAAQSGVNLPYEFVVLNNSVPNAWALPGGKIAINRGLLVELDSEAELAAVLGHEIVHAAARHGAQGMERGTLLQGALIAAAFLEQVRRAGLHLLGGSLRRFHRPARADEGANGRERFFEQSRLGQEVGDRQPEQRRFGQAVQDLEHVHRRAGHELPVDLDDAHRQQAPARAQRLHGTVVEP